MPHARRFLLLITLGLLLTNCGEDRSGEYYTLIGSRQWIYSVMEEYYLFYEDLPETVTQDDYLQSNEDFLKDMCSSKDKKSSTYFSHIDSVRTTTSRSVAVSSTANFGYEGVLVRVTSGVYGIQVLYTQPDSPASDAGLKRGDWIIAADGTKITSSGYSKYVSSPTQGYTFTLGSLNGTSFDTLGTVKVSSPEYVAEESFVMHEVLELDDGHRAGYVVYNAFNEDDATEWTAILNEFASEGVDDLIIDLRYNPGGYVSAAASLGSMLIPSQYRGQVMAKLIWNDLIGETDVVYFTDEGVDISYNNLYILTSSSSASASEMLINCLRPYMSDCLYQVGEDTFGKNVAQSCYTSDDYPLLELWLSTCYISNSEDYYDYYYYGLDTDYEAEEDTSEQLPDFGDPSDALLAPVIMHITEGIFEVEEEEEEEDDDSSEVSVLRSVKREVAFDPIAQKKKYCKIR